MDIEKTANERFKNALEKANKSIETIKESTDQGFKDLAELGYRIEESVNSIGANSFYEFVHNEGLNLTKNMQTLARKCQRSHQKGQTISPDQLLLNLANDAEPNSVIATKEVRSSEAKWIRHVTNAKQNFQTQLKKKPLQEWTDFEKKTALTITSQIVEIHNMIESSQNEKTVEI